MSIRFYCLFACSFLLAATASAQVRRKGTTPLMRGNGNPESRRPAGNLYTLEQFRGKWIEIKRTEGTNEVAIEDSLMLNIYGEDSAETSSSQNKHLRMLGIVELNDDGTVVIAGDYYDIESVKPEELVLSDDDGSHVFIKTSRFYTGAGATAASVAAHQHEYSKPVQAEIAQLLGSWSVYKRDVRPGTVSEKIFIIRSLNITDKTGAYAAKGIVTIYTQPVTDSSAMEQIPATITLSGTNMKIVTAQTTWDLPVYRADGVELVLGAEGLRYYCKADAKK